MHDTYIRVQKILRSSLTTPLAFVVSTFYSSKIEIFSLTAFIVSSSHVNNEGSGVTGGCEVTGTVMAAMTMAKMVRR